MSAPKILHQSLLIGCFLFLCVKPSCAISQYENTERRVALIIGNSAYQNAPFLPNPKNDAIALGDIFKSMGFDTDIRTNLPKEEMDKALLRFGDKLDAAQAAVFYYAGHGIQINGVNYLLPVDASLRSLRKIEFETTNLNSVLRQMEGSGRVNIIFLDACRDNPFSGILHGSLHDNQNVVIGKGLARIDTNAGTIISFATKEGEVASDGKGEHSPYTQALLRHLQTPNLEIAPMLRRVREEVYLTTNQKQTPWEYGSLLKEFYFTKPAWIVDADRSPLPKAGMELAYWQSIMNDTTPAMFESYINKYPKGEFVELAKLKLEALRAKEYSHDAADRTTNNTGVEKQTGEAFIGSDPPGAAVFINGEPFGTSQLNISGLQPGKTKIELKAPCHETWSSDILIKPGQKITINPRLKNICGRIRITTNPPAAEVWLDNQRVGKTPMELDLLTAGNHDVVLRLNGYADWNKVVDIKASQTVELKNIALTTTGSETAGETITSEKSNDIKELVSSPARPDSVVRQVFDETKYEISKDAGFGLIQDIAAYRLTVEPDPADARVRLLKSKFRYEPGIHLPVGKYQLEVSKPGYERFHQLIEIKDGDLKIPAPLKLTTSEKPKNGILRVTTNPGGAKVFLDDRPVGSTPVEVKGVVTGGHSVRIFLKGYEELIEHIDVQRGKNTLLEVDLSTVPGSIQPRK